MQACSFRKFCLGMCDWTDSSTRTLDRARVPRRATPKLERDLQQEVEGGRQPLTYRYHVRGRAHGASETSFTFESSREVCMLHHLCKRC